ncbi:metallophosphoesterase family protein [Planococcus sp. N028]|uniref:Metallophosphoesterase family protein n=1 Tax=Planococcus shixiaomingii TaxID=3058393 RepID=A0ABT8N3C2_9BACL|nr:MULTISPECIES: metallophosphoesterase family protein [unclassified Planococcus (in: firmicutes)]MDN7242382.1 metallophosphoesterase family protein [Planococcus sp. N028]WKA54623.1 metallophosphoesterase family protein [Planococcus sp. N022]
MKFAVITDVHGNAPALQAVLGEIERTGEVEHIFCLGDMIGIGPDTNEVLEMLFSRDDISMVTGNHDEAVLALVQGQQHPRSHFHVKHHHQWIAKRIDPDFVSKLAKLPRTIRKRFNGHSALFTHYRINDAKLQAPISTDPFEPIVEPTLQNMKKLFANSKEDLICFGHHHPSHFFANGRTIYLNPGALGCSAKPAAPYAIVSVGEQGINVAIEEAAYDNREFLLSYEKLKVPEREFILKVFHGDQWSNSV